MAGPRRPHLFVAVALGGVLTASIAVLLFTYLDARTQQGKVLRNVSIDGHSVAGLDQAGLDEFLIRLEAQYRTEPVRITAAGGGFSAPGSEFGLRFDRVSMRTAALKAGRTSKGLGLISSYWMSFVRGKSVPVEVRVDQEMIEKSLETHEPGRRNPIDPEIRVRNGQFSVTPGREGLGIQATAIASTLPTVARKGLPITITANRLVLPPRFDETELQRAVDDATLKTEIPIPIRAGEREGTVTSKMLRSWVRAKVDGRRVELLLDEELTIKGIQKLLGVVGTPARDARLVIGEGGTVTAVPSVIGTSCCTPESVTTIERAMGTRLGVPLTLPLKTVHPKLTTEQVMSFGVKERISAYTTKHKSGEPRVKNIHRIADLLRGTVIPPGVTFSVNDAIGPRTTQKGFVNAPSIVDGVHEDSVGGGISQFATTLFNAAFFGGLDLVEYQSHSQYFSRYPYGREATMGFPNPDLKIRNNTPYGVMIWPTYTAAGITVELYSTAYVKGEQVKQTKSTVGKKCVRVTTVRKRTFLDGRTVTDQTKALYRPGEGLDCNLNPTAGVSTTTKPRSTERTTPRDSSARESTATTRRRTRATAATNVERADESPPPTRRPRPDPPDEPPATRAEGPVSAGRPPVTGVSSD